MSYNRCILMGRLTAAPEMKSTGDGIEYCRFTVACDRDYVKKDQEREADFISCTAWRGTAAFVGKYFSKGSMIHVEGKWRHNRHIIPKQTLTLSSMTMMICRFKGES